MGWALLLALSPGTHMGAATAAAWPGAWGRAWAARGFSRSSIIVWHSNSVIRDSLARHHRLSCPPWTAAALPTPRLLPLVIPRKTPETSRHQSLIPRAFLGLLLEVGLWGLADSSAGAAVVGGASAVVCPGLLCCPLCLVFRLSARRRGGSGQTTVAEFVASSTQHNWGLKTCTGVWPATML